MNEFNYKLFRYSSGPVSSLGLLMAGSLELGKAFRCYTLEDEYRAVKVPGHTRIPAGTFEIKRRFDSPKFKHYDDKFAPWHRGMLWLQNVPGFEWVYIHPGNRHENTDGCLLVGDAVTSNREQVGEGQISYSVNAYERLYKEITLMLDDGKRVFLTIEDIA